MYRPLHIEVEGEKVAVSITGTEIRPTGQTFFDVTINTTRGKIGCRFYQARSKESAVLMVGGIGGGFDTPANDLYPKLAESLLSDGISTLRVMFRQPSDLTECVMDVLTGLQFLRTQGCASAGLVGHSLGGAVVIQAAAIDPMVKTVIALSTQSYGTEPVLNLKEGVSVLLIHGREDKIISSSSSVHVYSMAKEPKRLVLFEKTGHSLDESAGDVFEEVKTWLEANLSSP